MRFTEYFLRAITIFSIILWSMSGNILFFYIAFFILVLDIILIILKFLRK